MQMLHQNIGSCFYFFYFFKSRNLLMRTSWNPKTKYKQQTNKAPRKASRSPATLVIVSCRKWIQKDPEISNNKTIHIYIYMMDALRASINKLF